MSQGQGPVTNMCGDKATGMSLAELTIFVQDCLRRDLDPASTFISVVPGWRKNRLEKITATPRKAPTP